MNDLCNYEHNHTNFPKASEIFFRNFIHFYQKLSQSMTTVPQRELRPSCSAFAFFSFYFYCALNSHVLPCLNLNKACFNCSCRAFVDHLLKICGKKCRSANRAYFPDFEVGGSNPWKSRIDILCMLCLKYFLWSFSNFDDTN